VPLPTAVGRYMRLSMQPLPVLTEAQVRLEGPLQPAGKVPNPAVIDRFVAVAPSSVVNVKLNAAPDPTTTSMAPLGEGVATILLFVGIDGAGN
jgi:hypothetical protein